MTLIDDSQVYTLQDLPSWSFKGTSLALIGHPVKHSFSASINNTAFQNMEGFNDWHYFKFDVPPEDLTNALDLFHERGFIGINLTLPHKVEVIPLLTDIEPMAKKMGAVNTLLRNDKGYKGFNTDGHGLGAALKEAFKTSLDDKVIVLLGAGGAAKAAAVQCLDSHCKALWIGNRSQARLQTLIEHLKAIGFNQVKHFSLDDVPKEISDADFLINATSLGLKKDDPMPIALDTFSPSKLKVFDMIYNPRETQLLKEAHLKGMQVSNGLRMLVEQATKAMHIWTQKAPPKELCWEKAIKSLEAISQ